MKFELSIPICPLFLGIKVIKFYGWELSFEKLINSLKEKELKLLKKCGLFYGMLNFSFGFTTYVVSFTRSLVAVRMMLLVSLTVFCWYYHRNADNSTTN